jgi:hypothetical protein
MERIYRWKTPASTAQVPASIELSIAEEAVLPRALCLQLHR